MKTPFRTRKVDLRHRFRCVRNKTSSEHPDSSGGTGARKDKDRGDEGATELRAGAEARGANGLVRRSKAELRLHPTAKPPSRRPSDRHIPSAAEPAAAAAQLDLMTSSHVALSVQEASAADVSGNARARSVVWIGVEEDEDEVGAALVEEEEVGRGGVVLVEGAGVDVDVEGVGVEDDDEDGWTPLVVAAVGTACPERMPSAHALSASICMTRAWR